MNKESVAIDKEMDAYFVAATQRERDPAPKKPSDSYQFQVGDKVEYGGVHGVVSCLDNTCGPRYSFVNHPVSVRFSDGHIETFTADGRVNSWHKKPLLILVEKAKKKVTKMIQMWCCLLTDGRKYHYYTRAQADTAILNSSCNGIIVELSGTYECEE